MTDIPTYNLPPAQEQTIAAITGGATMKAAAEAAAYTIPDASDSARLNAVKFPQNLKPCTVMHKLASNREIRQPLRNPKIRKSCTVMHKAPFPGALWDRL
jgi:hypothetical protein